MTASASPALASPFSITATPATFLVQAHPGRENERRSARSGKLPRATYNAQREEADPNYAARMAETRRELSREMYEGKANCVARLRLAAGLSQHQLSALAGITQPHLAKIESGKLSIQLSTAVSLADALGVSLDELRPLTRLQERTPQNVSVGSL